MNTLIRGSHGWHQRDREPVRYEGDWSQFIDLWRGYAAEPRHPSTKELSTPFVSPFILRDGAIGKTKENLCGCGAWAGIDIDAAGWSLSDLTEVWGDYDAFIHTTTKSTTAHPRFRVLYRLSRELSDESEHLAQWHYVNNVMAGGTVDRATKNINRLLFVPALWEGAWNAHETVTGGNSISVESALRWSQATPQRVAVTTRRGSSHGGVSMLAGVPIPVEHLITSVVEAQFRSAPEGGRYYRLLCAMSARCKCNGWAVTAERLAREADRLDDMVTGKSRDGVREAARALAWANGAVTPETPLQRVSRLLKWRHAK